MSVDESWHEPSHLQWFISNFTYENLLGYRLPFPMSSSLSLYLETGWCGRLTDYLEALFISLVFPRGVMKPLLQRAVPAMPGKALAVPMAGLCCSALKNNCVPHFEGTPQFLTSRESAHQSAQDLLVWEAEWSREFPCLTLIETTSISLAGGKLPVILRRAVAWTMLKKASHHTNSIITYQSAFFLSCLLGHQSVEGWCCSKELCSSCKSFAPISSSQIAHVLHVPMGLWDLISQTQEHLPSCILDPGQDKLRQN